MLLMMNPSFSVPNLPPVDCGGIGQVPKLGDSNGGNGPPCFGIPQSLSGQQQQQQLQQPPTSSAIKSGMLADSQASASPTSLSGPQTSRPAALGSNAGGGNSFQWSCAAAGSTGDGTSALSSFGPTSGYYACYDAAAADRSKTNAAAAAAAAFKMWPTAPGYPDFHHHHHHAAAAAANAAMSCHQAAAADMYANAFAHHQSWPYTAYHHPTPSAYERSLQTFQVKVLIFQKNHPCLPVFIIFRRLQPISIWRQRPDINRPWPR